MDQSIIHVALVVRDYDEMLTNGVHFVREPKTASYGTVAEFQALYGSLWDLVELKNDKTG